MNFYRGRRTITIAIGLLSVSLSSGTAIVTAEELSPDGRTEIAVSLEEREQVLEEMRGLLEAVQKVLVANNAGDLDAVAEASRVVGKENMDPRSAEFSSKLPMAFRKLGMDTQARSRSARRLHRREVPR